MTIMSIFLVSFIGYSQTDTLISFEWDKSTSINPYEEPSDVVFDFTKVQERYREVLETMNNLSTGYNTKIIIAEEKSNESTNNDALKTYLRNLKKDQKNLKRDINAYVKIYNRNGASIKLHKANKKYSKKYLEKNTVDNNDGSKNTQSTLVHSSKSNGIEFSDFKEQIDLSYNSFPGISCAVVFNGVDNSTMKERKQLKSYPFFYYTHKNLKSYYKDQSFLEGFASVMELGDYTFVTFKIIIKSKDARRNYGIITENSLMRIKTISGELIYLPAFNTSNSSINKDTGFTEYYVAFGIDKENKRDLKKSDIDKIGIMWSSGFEEYDVYAVDLIKEQLKCLKKL